MSANPSDATSAGDNDNGEDSGYYRDFEPDDGTDRFAELNQEISGAFDD